MEKDKKRRESLAAKAKAKASEKKESVKQTSLAKHFDKVREDCYVGVDIRAFPVSSPKLRPHWINTPLLRPVTCNSPLATRHSSTRGSRDTCMLACMVAQYKDMVKLYIHTYGYILLTSRAQLRRSAAPLSTTPHHLTGPYSPGYLMTPPHLPPHPDPPPRTRATLRRRLTRS